MLTTEQKAKIRAHIKARLTEGCCTEKNCKKEEGLISTINGAVDNVQNLVTDVLEEKETPVKDELVEAINDESDLILKLKPLSESDIYEFMDNLKGGTYFNMGMYSSIPIARAYKSTYRLYKVIEMSAIVSGIDYENKEVVKKFRAATDKAAGDAFYLHEPGREHKVGINKKDENVKYVLWDIKSNSGTEVKYYLVDIATGKVTPVTKQSVLDSDYLTPSEKAKMQPKPVTGYDKTTGELIENEANWRTARFEHIFWLNQAGKATREYGTRFSEEFDLQEEIGADIFRDGHPNAANLDDILDGLRGRSDRFVDNDLFTDFE